MLAAVTGNLRICLVRARRLADIGPRPAGLQSQRERYKSSRAKKNELSLASGESAVCLRSLARSYEAAVSAEMHIPNHGLSFIFDAPSRKGKPLFVWVAAASRVLPA